MLFTAALEEVKKMVPEGTMHTLRYGLTTYHDGTQVAECSIYVADHGWVSDKPSWEVALEDMRRRMAGAPDVRPSLEEAPL